MVFPTLLVFLASLVSRKGCVICCCCLVTQSCPALCDLVDGSLPGSPVHGISQVRTLQWVAISFFMRSSQSRDRIHVSCTDRLVFNHRTTRDAKPGLWITVETNPVSRFLVLWEKHSSTYSSHSVAGFLIFAAANKLIWLLLDTIIEVSFTFGPQMSHWMRGNLSSENRSKEQWNN